jgi:hypothetical protein
VTLTYDNGTNLSVTMTDPVAETSFSTNEAINIPTAVGETNTAYVGFTGGATGGWISYQIITNFTFVSLIPGLPEIAGLPIQVVATEGSTVQIAAMVAGYGDLPMSYQWQFTTNVVSWTSLANGATVRGAQSNVLTIASAQASSAGFYQLIVSNANGAVTSSVAQVQVTPVTIASNPLTFDNGEDWSASGGGPYTTVEFTNGVLTLTDAGGSDEARGFWFEDPVYIGAFKASFTYQDVAGGSGNGATFCLQNNTDPGYGGFTQALGWNSGLGVAGIEPSWELEWSALPAWTGAVGYCFSTNGNCPGVNDWPTGGGPATYLPTGTVNLSSGDPINMTLFYNGTTLSMTMTDTVESTSFGTNEVINIPTAVGGNSTAYVGFTGGSTGGWIFTEIITNFTFVSLATPSIQISGTNALISWSQSIPGYTLQENSNLASTNWVNVTNTVESVNGQYQVLVPPSGTNEFYRLILSP